MFYILAFNGGDLIFILPFLKLFSLKIFKRTAKQNFQFCYLNFLSPTLQFSNRKKNFFNFENKYLMTSHFFFRSEVNVSLFERNFYRRCFNFFYIREIEKFINKIMHFDDLYYFFSLHIAHIKYYILCA